VKAQVIRQRQPFPLLNAKQARMANNLSVRFVAREDYVQWLPLWDGYNAFYARSGATALAPEITRTTWGRFFDAYEPVHALVAEQAAKLLGLTHYLFHRSTTAIGPTCYLQDLFTTEAARGKGVGRALIEAVYEQARLAGSARVYWQTHETNHTAMQLYDKVAERSGFIVYRKLV
jgi:GNAT superfamily N-acetyltransferase